MKDIGPSELTIMKRAILFSIFFLSVTVLVFSFCPTGAWAAVPLQCGQIMSTTTTTRVQEDYYTFTANTGDTIRIVAAKVSGGTSFSPAMALYDPSGAVIATAGSSLSSSLIEKALTVTGNYTVRAYDYNYDDIGTYQIRWDKLNNPCAGRTSLSCAQAVSATTTARVQEDYYTFTANTGDTVRIVAVKVSGSASFSPAMALYDPSGSLIATAGGSTSAIIEKSPTTSGNYTVRVYDYGYNDVGTYQIRWDRVNNPCGGKVTLSCGQSVSGTTTSYMQEDYYTFTAAAGDTVRIVAAKVSGSASFSAAMALYDPSGTIIATSTSAPIEKALTASGDYTVRVYDNYYDATGTYQIRWDRVNNPCGGKVTLPCGQSVSGTTTSYAQEDYYTLTAAAGDTVRIVAAKVSGTAFSLAMALYDPSGAVIATSASAPIEKALTTSGNYTVRVYDNFYDGTGTYQIRWDKLNNPCSGKVTLLCGQSMSATTTSVVQEDYYTLTAAAGDTVRIVAAKVSGTAFSLAMSLYDPSGAVIATSTSAPIEKALTTSGNYTVRVYDSFYDGTGTYQIRWDKLNNPCSGKVTLLCRQSMSATTTSVVQEDYYTLTAAAGDTVRIVAAKVSGSTYFGAPAMALYDPSGAVIATSTGAPIEKALTTAGDYTLRVYDYNYDGTGTYQIKWDKLNNPCAGKVTLPIGLATSGSTTSYVQDDYYTFTAGAGDMVRIVAAWISGSTYFTPAMVLYDPSGTVIATVGGPNSVIIEKALTASGNYTIRVYDYNYDGTGTYQIRWDKLNNPGGGKVTLTCGLATSGMTTSYVQEDYYAFTAWGGDTVRILATEVSGSALFTPGMVLYDPSGAVIATASGFTSATIEKALTASGDYTVRVYDDYYNGTGTYQIRWDELNNPCAYTITASAGANGTISPLGVVSVLSGATTTFTMTPNIGYHISDVLVDLVSQGAITSYTFTNVAANHTITASFAIDSYNINASADANGTISPSGVVNVNTGASAIFIMTPNIGYHVSDVLVDLVSQGAITSYTFTNVTADHTITASFAPKLVTAVTVDPTVLDLSYGQVMTIKYTLSEQANVTVTLQQDSTTPITVFSGVQSAGTQEILEWNGFDNSDSTNNKFVINLDNYYLIRVVADSAGNHGEAAAYVMIRR